MCEIRFRARRVYLLIEMNCKNYRELKELHIKYSRIIHKLRENEAIFPSNRSKTAMTTSNEKYVRIVHSLVCLDVNFVMV